MTRKQAGVTRKPPELLRRLISVYSAPGDLVVDPCLGSGTTAEMARELGRSCVGYEVQTVKSKKKGESCDN